MNMKMAMTTIAGLAVAGTAMACECGEKTKATGLTVETAPTVLKVGHEGHGKTTTTTTTRSSDSDSQELKVIITDGEARFWVDGKEVNKAEFSKAGGHAVVTAAPKALWKTAGAPKADNIRVAAAPAKPVRLGVVLGEVSDELAHKLDVDADEVILIERVMDGTPAAKAGLKSFDVLVEFDGEDGLSIEKLRKLISKQNPGNSVEVIVLRDGDDEEFEVVFGGDIEANQFVAAAAPPHAQAGPRAPRGERFFGREMNEEARAHFERAMEHAEQQAHEAQKHAAQLQSKLKHMYSDANKNGMNFQFKLDGQDHEDIEKAMAMLREHMEELDLDIDFNFNFDADEFPQIRFIEGQMHENAGKLKERAAVLQERIMEKHQHQVEREAREHEGRAAELERRVRREAERGAQGADRQIERLERRIEELEAVIEKLVSKLEEKPRGVRN